MARRQPRARGGTEVERKIYFYRVNCGQQPGGEPISFPVDAMAARINELDFENGERYLAHYADVHTCCWVDRGGSNARLRLADVRRSGLPEVETAGVLAPLPIPRHSGLAETVYVRFCPDNIVGAIFNFYGPRISRLSYYLDVKAHDVCPHVQFDPLLRHDALDRILDMRRITLFQLRIRKAYIAEVAEEDESLGAAFRAAFRAGDGEEAEITLRATRGRNGMLDRGLRRVARALGRRDDRDEGITHFIVKGAKAGERRAETVDVLSDELLVTRAVQLQEGRTRALNRISAYEAIDQAYEEMRPVLEAAGAAGEENG